MRTFQQLSQNDQMIAVENAVEEIIHTTTFDRTHECFENFMVDIEDIYQQTCSATTGINFNFSEYFETALRERIENNKAMKIAMLHGAGKIAKETFYVEDRDRVDCKLLSYKTNCHEKYLQSR